MSDRPREQPVAPRTLPCDVAVLFRDAETAGGLIDRLHDAAHLRANGFTIRLGKFGERAVALGIAGKTTSLVAMADSVAYAHKPQLIVVGTLAIGLAEGVKPNTVFLADGLVVERAERIELLPWTDIPYRRGLLWATNDLTSPPPDAIAAMLADVYPLAKWCRREDIPLEIAAVVTRHVTDPPPTDVRQVLNQRSLAGRMGALLGAAWRRPSSVPDLWHEKENIWIARERLGDAIERIVIPSD